MRVIPLYATKTVELRPVMCGQVVDLKSFSSLVALIIRPYEWNGPLDASRVDTGEKPALFDGYDGAHSEGGDVHLLQTSTVLKEAAPYIISTTEGLKIDSFKLATPCEELTPHLPHPFEGGHVDVGQV